MNLYDDLMETTVFIRNAIRDIPDRHSQNNEALQRNRQEELDLLHLIELTNMNASDGFKIYKELQRVLRERRKLKDENSQLEPLANTIKKFKGQLTELDKVVGEVRKAQGGLKNRTYKARVRTDYKKNLIRRGTHE